ncbi:hypothetical protein DIPPA_35194 [Diplonema papillatum]|nr:hypothetical protein DIPPA_35194 [Diplonema papillatum]
MGAEGVFVEVVVTDATPEALAQDLQDLTAGLNDAANHEEPLYKLANVDHDMLILDPLRYITGQTTLQTQGGPPNSKWSAAASASFQEPVKETDEVYWWAYTLVIVFAVGSLCAFSSLLVVKTQKTSASQEGLVSVAEFYRTMPDGAGPIPEEHYCINGRDDGDSTEMSSRSSTGARNVAGFGVVQLAGRI